MRWCSGLWIAVALSACAEPEPRLEIVSGPKPDREQQPTASSTESPVTGLADADADPEHGAERSAASRAAQPPQPEVFEQLGPARGRILTVGPGVALAPGRSYPAERLREALQALQPGDRLVLEPGLYEGPIRIDSSMQDGRNPEPIEVVAKTDAVFTITDKNSSASAVLQVERSFWEFHGLEVRSPLSGAGGIELANVKTVLFASCHVHNLGGAGIRTLDKVREVRIENSHIHQIGFGRRAGDAFGIAIADAKTSLRLDSSHIHHTTLGAISIAGTVLRSAEAASALDTVEIRDSEIK